MLDEKLCQDCSQGPSCQQRYQQSANLKGPSVTYQVTIAFLLPLLVFIVTLAIFEKILSAFEIAANLRVVFSMAESLLVTVVLVLIVKSTKA